MKVETVKGNIELTLNYKCLMMIGFTGYLPLSLFKSIIDTIKIRRLT